MQEIDALKNKLRQIDHKSYKAYKDITGAYEAKDYQLHVDHVQGDPFAAPSRLRLLVRNAFSEDYYGNESREIAFCDYLQRSLARAMARHSKGHRGSGKGGKIEIDRAGQCVLHSNAVTLEKGSIVVRFYMGLPAFGRKIAGEHAEKMFFEELPAIVQASLFKEAIDLAALKEHVDTVEDAEILRASIAKQGLTAFVANGSVLPRRSGVDARPLENAVHFQSPESLTYTFTLKHCSISGLGLPKGVSLIVGGGYHGKSTLLSALEEGIYNHKPGDGREFVVADSTAVKIRAEDSRFVSNVDISPFIKNLPQEKDTTRFSSENASGSTSQAANIIEALELESTALLIDEDTSATNFMIRDRAMQKLVAKNEEPITPFIDKARALYSDFGVSTTLVVGGSGSYFHVADTVVQMKEYQPYDVTEKARSIAEEEVHPPQTENSFGNKTQRIVPKGVHKEVANAKMKTRGLANIQFDHSTIDLSYCEQILHPSQTRAIAHAIKQVLAKSDQTLTAACKQVAEEARSSNFASLTGPGWQSFAQFRALDLAAALNRFRGNYIKGA